MSQYSFLEGGGFCDCGFFCRIHAEADGLEAGQEVPEEPVDWVAVEAVKISFYDNTGIAYVNHMVSPAGNFT